jgi:hypothetical protein
MDCHASRVAAYLEEIAAMKESMQETQKENAKGKKRFRDK